MTYTITYSMTAVVITPGTGDITTGYYTVLDGDSQPVAGVSIYVQIVRAASSETGFAHDNDPQVSVSDGDGLVEFALIKGASYKAWRGAETPTAPTTTFTIAADAGATTSLKSVIGP